MRSLTRYGAASTDRMNGRTVGWMDADERSDGRMNGWTGGSGQGGSPYAVGPATKIRPRGAYTRPHKSRPSHKLRYGSIKVKIMYEICLLIILSAGGARLPLLRSRALGPFPPAYLTVAVMPLDREPPYSFTGSIQIRAK